MKSPFSLRFSYGFPMAPPGPPLFKRQGEVGLRHALDAGASNSAQAPGRSVYSGRVPDATWSKGWT